MGRSELDRVEAYVRRQKEHHAEGTLWPELEENYEDFTPETTAKASDHQS